MCLWIHRAKSFYNVTNWSLVFGGEECRLIHHACFAVFFSSKSFLPQQNILTSQRACRGMWQKVYLTVYITRQCDEVSIFHSYALPPFQVPSKPAHASVNASIVSCYLEKTKQALFLPRMLEHELENRISFRSEFGKDLPIKRITLSCKTSVLIFHGECIILRIWKEDTLFCVQTTL